MKKLVLLLVFFSSFVFSQMPSLSGISSSLATSTSIRIDYTINANGSNTNVVIKYGLTPTNLNYTFNCPDVTGSTHVAQFRIVGNMLSGTTYYYAVEATNSNGTNSVSGFNLGGGNRVPFQFTTTSPANLPVISNVSVVGLIDGGATIRYSVNANGYATNTSVEVGNAPNVRDSYASGPTVTGSSPVSNDLDVNYGTISFDNPGSTVYFNVFAYSSIGSVASAEGQFTLVYKPNFGTYTITNVTSTSVTMNYTLKPNGGNTTSAVRYGSSIGNYPNSVTGITASGFTPNTGNVTINNLTPGETYYWILEGTNQYGVNQTTVNVFTTSQIPIITSVSSSNITTSSATINYAIKPYSSSGPITPVIRYGTDSNNLNLSQNCTPVQGNGNYSQTQILTGLTSGVTYFYRVEATNSIGIGGNLATPSQFTTIATVTAVPNPIYNFEFNNSLISQDGLVTMGTPWPNPIAYVSNGTNSTGALRFDGDRNITELTTLPLGATSRSVHFRIKYAADAFTAENYVFTYGINNGGQAFSFNQTTTAAKFIGVGAAADFTANVATTSGVWYEYMLVYNGTSINIYRDGVSLGSQNVTLNTAALPGNPMYLRIGQSAGAIPFLKADLDYFRVFNQALSSLEVAYITANPGVLNSSDFNQNNLQVSLYPNPATDVLNIEMTNEINSIEIYNIQGQKVLSSTQKQINIAGLAAGMYMIRIQDNENGIATKKFVKK